MQLGPGTGSNATQGQVVLGCIRMQTEQASKQHTPMASTSGLSQVPASRVLLEFGHWPLLVMNYMVYNE